jgi:hypothetical protein
MPPKILIELENQNQREKARKRSLCLSAFRSSLRYVNCKRGIPDRVGDRLVLFLDFIRSYQFD